MIVSRRTFFVVIKPTEDATYKNVVDMLDEMTINKVSRYALVKPFDSELDAVRLSGGASAATPAETPAK